MSGPRIVVIGLTPPEDLARFLGELRARYPEAAFTAVIGTQELEAAAEGADEVLRWDARPARGLLAELRHRRPALVAVPYNTEYGAALTYWKALALATLARARGVLFCREARLPESPMPLGVLARPLPRAAGLLRALGYGLWRLVLEALILVLGALLLPVLLGIIVVDLAGLIVRLARRQERSGVRARGS